MIDGGNVVGDERNLVVFLPLSVLRCHGVGLWGGEVAHRSAFGLNGGSFGEGELGCELCHFVPAVDVESHFVVGDDGFADEQVAIYLARNDVGLCIEGFVPDARCECQCQQECQHCESHAC